jgi:hypothetical protein
MDRLAGIVLLLLCGIAIGAGGMRMWQWSGYVDAIKAKEKAIGERDELVARLAKAEAERDKAQARARAERQEIYARDEEAAAWARAPVPPALRERVRNAAVTADAAAAPGSSDVPKASAR